jgi:hypothetical protein
LVALADERTKVRTPNVDLGALKENAARSSGFPAEETSRSAPEGTREGGGRRRALRGLQPKAGFATRTGWIEVFEAELLLLQ